LIQKSTSTSSAAGSNKSHDKLVLNQLLAGNLLRLIDEHRFASQLRNSAKRAAQKAHYCLSASAIEGIDQRQFFIGVPPNAMGSGPGSGVRSAVASWLSFF